MSEIYHSRHECAYCGWTGNTRDHVPALSTYWIGNRKSTANRLPAGHLAKTVPACTECNSLLGAFPSSNLRHRAEHLTICLERRYKKLLHQPVWSEEEIKSLGPTMRKFVRAQAAKRQIVIDRLAHLGTVSRFGSETVNEYHLNTA